MASEGLAGLETCARKLTRHLPVTHSGPFLDGGFLMLMRPTCWRSGGCPMDSCPPVAPSALPRVPSEPHLEPSQVHAHALVTLACALAGHMIDTFEAVLADWPMRHATKANLHADDSASPRSLACPVSTLHSPVHPPSARARRERPARPSRHHAQRS